MTERSHHASAVGESGAGPTSISNLTGAGFLVVTGKGGVGKSAVAATLGRSLARSAAGTGRRTLVVEVDPRENLHQLLGTAPSGGEILEAGEGLFLQHLKPRTVVDRVIEERVKIGAVVRKVQASSVYQHFVEGCPGLEELAVLEHARRLLTERRFDTVILDAPATGHGVSLLRAPLVVSEAVGEGPFGSIAREIADLVADPARCGVVIVTQAEEMPVQEAQDLARMLEEQLDRGPDLLVVNGLYPPLPRADGALGGDGADEQSPNEADQADQAGQAAPDALVDLWRRRRAINRRELRRLADVWPGEMVGLPLLPIGRGPELVAALDACWASDPHRALGSVWRERRSGRRREGDGEHSGGAS